MHETTPLPPSTQRQLATINDAAAYVGVHPATLRRWINTRQVTAYRVGPRVIRIDLAELDAMLSPINGGAADAC